MIRFLNLESGSKGNATLIYDETTLFQIDMGVPLKVLKDGLLSLGKKTSDIQALLLTHEHCDHISTIPTLKGAIPLYCSEGTYQNPCKTLVPGSSFTLGDFAIDVMQTSHDAANPIGFVIHQQSESLVYVTDTGYLSDENLAKMAGATYYIIESNHDYKMLLASHRPASLKHRIHSDVGHLSNVDSAFYLADLVSENTKGIYLAHLSEECNTPEKALSAYESSFQKKGIHAEKYHLVCLQQWAMTPGGDL